MEGVSTTYDTVRAMAEIRGPRFLTSWDELCQTCGYANKLHGLRSLQRYTAALEDVGLIKIRAAHVGRWMLGIELPEEMPFSSASGAQRQYFHGGLRPHSTARLRSPSMCVDLSARKAVCDGH